MSITGDARRQQGTHGTQVTVRRRKPQRAMTGTIGSGGIGTVREQQRQALQRVGVERHLQQEFALRQSWVRGSAGVEQLPDTGRIVARHGQGERGPLGIDRTGVRGVEFIAGRRPHGGDMGLEPKAAQRVGGRGCGYGHGCIERVVATLIECIQMGTGRAQRRDRDGLIRARRIEQCRAVLRVVSLDVRSMLQQQFEHGALGTLGCEHQGGRAGHIHRVHISPELQ